MLLYFEFVGSFPTLRRKSSYKIEMCGLFLECDFIFRMFSYKIKIMGYTLSVCGSTHVGIVYSTFTCPCIL